MWKTRLNLLFDKYPKPVQDLLSITLQLENEHLSMERPRLKEPLDQVVTKIAMAEIEKEAAETEEVSPK